MGLADGPVDRGRTEELAGPRLREPLSEDVLVSIISVNPAHLILSVETIDGWPASV